MLTCACQIYGTLYWDPTAIIALWTNRAAAFFCAFAFGLATLGTNISTNSIATSNDLAFMFPRWLNLRRGAVITALLGGWATAPWKIQASAKSLTTFLSGYIIVMAPIVAIMVSRIVRYTVMMSIDVKYRFRTTGSSATNACTSLCYTKTGDHTRICMASIGEPW